MIEILPIRLLTDEEAWIFGSLNVALGKLARAGLPVGNGIVVTPPQFHLNSVLEHYDFKTKEVFEQSLTLVKREISKTLVPSIFIQETKKHKKFLLNEKLIKSTKQLWLSLLSVWLDQIKDRLWQDGFFKGITADLQPQVVIFVKKVAASGSAFFDPLQDDTVIQAKHGKLHPNDLKKLDDIVRVANKKLFIPHEYEWILDGAVMLTKVLPYTPSLIHSLPKPQVSDQSYLRGRTESRSAVKVFFDLSGGFTIEKQVDGIYIASEKIFDLNKPRDSFENLVFRVVESAITFPSSPVLFKLADKSEGMGKVRGTLRLLHQKSLFGPMLDTLGFIRHKKGLTNVHIVIPYVRAVFELMQVKKELATKNLSRNCLKQWLEIAVPENIINLEDYLITGIDGVVLNLDELISNVSGFDVKEQELLFYKKEVKGLLKFLEDGVKLLHKYKVPFISYGSLNLYPEVLEFLVQKGVYGIVVERYEVTGAHELLHQAEKRVIHTHL